MGFFPFGSQARLFRRGHVRVTTRMYQPAEDQGQRTSNDANVQILWSVQRMEKKASGTKL